MDWDGNWGVGGWLVMSLMMLVVWGVPIALAVWFAIWLAGNNHRPGQLGPTTSHERGAEQVLAERYARGEIDEEEFTRRREILRTGPKAS